MFKLFGKVKEKAGNVIIPVIGTLIGLGILATAVASFSINSNTIVYGTKNSGQTDARNILYIATNYFSEQINANGESNVATYREDLMVVYPGLDIRREIEDGKNAYFLYYPYQYNSDGTVKNYLRTKVKMGTEKTSNEDDSSGEQGHTHINDTMFSEEAKIDEKFNINNMGSLFLTESGLLPGRAYPTSEVSLIESDIDTFDEAFSYSSGSATMLIDNLIFCFFDPSKTGTSGVTYTVDANGNKIARITIYDPENSDRPQLMDVFYNVDKDGYYVNGVIYDDGEYYYKYIIDGSGKKVKDSSVSTKLGDGTYSYVPASLAIPTYIADADGNLNVFYETGNLGGNYYWMDVKGNANEVQSTTAMQIKAYKQDFNIDLLEQVISYKEFGASVGNKNISIYSYVYDEITDTHVIGVTGQDGAIVKSTYELAKYFESYIYEKNKGLYSKADMLEAMRIAYVKKAGNANLFDENGPFDSFMVGKVADNDSYFSNYRWNCVEMKKNYSYEDDDTKIKLEIIYTYKSGWSGSLTTDTASYSVPLLYDTSSTWFTTGKRSAYNMMTSDWSWAYGSGVSDDFDLSEGLVETLGYRYTPNTTVKEVIGDFGNDQNLDGYKQSAIANALLKRYVEDNKDSFKKNINGVLEDPTGLQIRTCGYTVVGDSTRGSYIKCKIEFYCKYSDGSREQKLLNDNTKWSYFQVFTESPSDGAIYSHTTSAGVKLYIPALIAKNGNFDNLAPITTINNIQQIGSSSDKIYENSSDGVARISANGKGYPAASTLSNNVNITSNKYVKGNTTITSSTTITISNNASLYIDGDLTLDSGADKLITIMMEPGTLLYVNGNINIKYQVFGSSINDCRSKGVDLLCNGANIMVNGDLNYYGYKFIKKYLLFIPYYSQNSVDQECTNSHIKDNLNEAYKTNYAADHNKGSGVNKVEGKSILAGTYMINGDLNFISSGGNANPLLNATLYVDGICDMTGLWTSGLYDRCRPNFLFARTITQPNVAWATVFPSGGLFSDTWCQTNGYLFMITEDAIDFSKLNFAAVNIYTPYDLATSELEANNRNPWDFSEFIDKQAISSAYFEQEMDLWGLSSLLRKGMGEVFKYEPAGNGNASLVDDITGDEF